MLWHLPFFSKGRSRFAEQDFFPGIVVYSPTRTYIWLGIWRAARLGAMAVLRAVTSQCAKTALRKFLQLCRDSMMKTSKLTNLWGWPPRSGTGMIRWLETKIEIYFYVSDICLSASHTSKQVHRWLSIFQTKWYLNWLNRIFLLSRRMTILVL